MATNRRDLAAELKTIPVGYWVLAVALGAVLYFLGSVTPERYGVFGNGTNADEFIRQWAAIGVLLAAVAPVIALVAPWVALVAAIAVPSVIMVFADLHQWPFTAFLSALAVAVCSMWSRPALSWWFATIALMLPLSLQLGGSMIVPDGAEIDLSTEGLPANLATFGLYLLGTGVILAAGRLFRRRTIGGAAGREALARAGDVEEQAAVVAERARLARDLHDVVAHHVSLIAVRAETAPYTHPDLEPTARTVLGEIAADARLALDELRGVLGILGRAGEDASRVPQPTWEDVDALVERARSSGTVVILAGDEALAADVGASVGYAAYRVVQEGLTNARKHAPGRPVTVTRTSTAGLIVVRVATPLRGEPPVTGAGHGLVGMRERVEALSGRLAAGAVGDEFVVEATLPRGTA